MNYVFFGNTLNKAKKNWWFYNKAQERLGSKVNKQPFEKVIKVGRLYNNIDNFKDISNANYDLATNLAIDLERSNPIKKLERIIKLNPDYTDIRKEPMTGKYMGFPNVNGYIETNVSEQVPMLDRKIEAIMARPFATVPNKNTLDKRGSLP